MSSYRTTLAGGLALAFALLLGGCFQPMYAPSNGRDVRVELAAISVMPISERLGHYLANELNFAFTGGDEEVQKRFKLVVTLRERVQTPLIDTVTGRANAATVMVDAAYVLTAIDDGRVVTEGTAIAAATYDRNSQRFANLRAARDAEIRDAKTLADQIRTRVAAVLARGG